MLLHNRQTQVRINSWCSERSHLLWVESRLPVKPPLTSCTLIWSFAVPNQIKKLSVALNFWNVLIWWWIYFIIINIFYHQIWSGSKLNSSLMCLLGNAIFNCHLINAGKLHTGSRKCLNLPSSPSFSYNVRPNHRCQHLWTSQHDAKYKAFGRELQNKVQGLQTW